jgi:hypothetical protein
MPKPRTTPSSAPLKEAAHGSLQVYNHWSGTGAALALSEFCSAVPARARSRISPCYNNCYAGAEIACKREEIAKAALILKKLLVLNRIKQSESLFLRQLFRID